MGELMRCLRRGIGRPRPFFAGLLRNWITGHLPKCYCHACGQCAHDAKYRFYKRYHNSCEACMVCENAHALWAESPSSQGHNSDHFEMTRWYKFRYMLGNIVCYIGGAMIHPKDPRDPKPIAPEPEIYARGNS